MFEWLKLKFTMIHKLLANWKNSMISYDIFIYWFCKESQKLFHKNHSKARKDLSQPKTSISLSTDKSKLDAYKSDCVKDDKDNIYLSSAKKLPD